MAKHKAIKEEVIIEAPITVQEELTDSSKLELNSGASLEEKVAILEKQLEKEAPKKSIDLGFKADDMVEFDSGNGRLMMGRYAQVKASGYIALRVYKG
jgi:transcription antitermination factor NusG